MLSLFFSILFIWAVVDAAREATESGMVKKVAIGVAAYAGGMVVLIGMTVAVGFLAAWLLFLLLESEQAMRWLRSEWLDRVISVSTTVALCYPFYLATRWCYRRLDRSAASATR